MRSHRIASSNHDQVTDKCFLINLVPNVAPGNRKRRAGPVACCAGYRDVEGRLEQNPFAKIPNPDLERSVSRRPKALLGRQESEAVETYFPSRSWPVFRITRRTLFTRAKEIPATSSSSSVALIVYTGDGPKLHLPCHVKFVTGQLLSMG